MFKVPPWKGLLGACERRGVVLPSDGGITSRSEVPASRLRGVPTLLDGVLVLRLGVFLLGVRAPAERSGVRGPELRGLLMAGVVPSGSADVKNTRK